MKSFTAFLLLSLFITLTACDKQQETATTGIPVTFTVNGMTCEGCVATVKETLAGIDGVIKYDVKLRENMAMVEFDPNVTSVSKIEAALKKTNFEIGAPRDSLARP